MSLLSAGHWIQAGGFSVVDTTINSEMGIRFFSGKPSPELNPLES